MTADSRFIPLLAITFLLGGCTGTARSYQEVSYRELRGVSYKTVDQQTLFADIYTPVTPGLKPAVLVVHGGGWNTRSGDMEWICRGLARAGFVAVNITYRLAPLHRFPAPVDDVREAMKWIQNDALKYEIDVNRIGGWGYSAGANLLLLAGLDPKIGFKALVAGGTPADLTAWPKSPEVLRFLGQARDTDLELWKNASPVNHVQSDSPPVFLYHGQWDWIVSIEQAEKMAAALESAKVDHETYVAPYMGHIWTYFFSHESFIRGVEFLRRKIGARRFSSTQGDETAPA